MNHTLPQPLLLSLVFALAIGLAACEAPEPETDDLTMDPATEETDPDTVEAAETFTSEQEVLDSYPEADAVAFMEPVGGSDARGYVLLQEMNGDLEFTVRMEGLAPGSRGFHAHEHGSCEPGEDGEAAGAAGGHFSPAGHPHGAPDDDAEQRHAGDFGNLEVGSDGTVDATFTDPVASLSGETSIMGLALIIHAEQDDLETQPTGDAGARVACGIVTAR